MWWWGGDGGCVLHEYFAHVCASVLCLCFNVETVEVQEELAELGEALVELRESSFGK